MKPPSIEVSLEATCDELARALNRRKFAHRGSGSNQSLPGSFRKRLLAENTTLLRSLVAHGDLLTSLASDDQAWDASVTPHHKRFLILKERAKEARS